MATNRMGVARLVLQFLKTLIWPLTLAVALFAFYDPVKTLILERLEKVQGPGGTSATFSTGPKKPDGSVTSPHPDIYFSLRDVSSLHNRTECVQHGMDALKQSALNRSKLLQRTSLTVINRDTLAWTASRFGVHHGFRSI